MSYQSRPSGKLEEILKSQAYCQINMNKLKITKGIVNIIFVSKVNLFNLHLIYLTKQVRATS